VHFYYYLYCTITEDKLIDLNFTTWYRSVFHSTHPRNPQPTRNERSSHSYLLIGFKKHQPLLCWSYKFFRLSFKI
jgi:hypothetical protein